jgi:membrane protein insertase Oxa1/YidC/SpoIIIJ
MMPVVMLFLFYNMASALVLYWSTSTVISVVQMMWQRRNATSQTTVAAPA